MGSEAQVSAQWRRLFKAVGDECAETLTHLKKELGPTARASLIWGAFVSKLPYMAGVQVPKRADEIMAAAQARLNEAMFGGRPGEVNGAFYFVSAETSHQRREDGGLAHEVTQIQNM